MDRPHRARARSHPASLGIMACRYLDTGLLYRAVGRAVAAEEDKPELRGRSHCRSHGAVDTSHLIDIAELGFGPKRACSPARSR
jgi:hypothetical protein